jgi:hypothetical protein
MQLTLWSAFLALAAIVPLATAASPTGQLCKKYNAQDPANANNFWYPPSKATLDEEDGAYYFKAYADGRGELYSFEIAAEGFNNKGVNMKVTAPYAKIHRHYKIKFWSDRGVFLAAYWADRNTDCDHSIEHLPANIGRVEILERCSKNCPKGSDHP